MISDSGSSSEPSTCVLPQGVVGVLDRQRVPVGRVAAERGRVRDHDVAGQRRHGEPVGADVVHHDVSTCSVGASRNRAARSGTSVVTSKPADTSSA